MNQIDTDFKYSSLSNEDKHTNDFKKVLNQNQYSKQNNVSKPNQVQQKSLIQAIFHEYEIIKKGFLNQEYRDYVMVKGASEQTIPLVLFVPLFMILGTTMCILVLFQNLRQGDPIIWTFVKTALFILFDGCISYLLLKGFEIVPKVIKNPLLFGRITTYIFFILLTVEGFLMLEYAVLKPNTYIITSQFWATIALVAWQKLLLTFIYDIRLRALFFFSLYTYSAFRVSTSYTDIGYNLYKCSLYLCVELIVIIDIELRNYASFQVEMSVMQTESKLKNQESVEFMMPPISISQQQSLLQNYSNIFPVALFSSNRILNNLSGIMQKLLQLEIFVNQEQQVDLVQAEIAIRKLEIVHIYDDDFNIKQEVKKIKRQTKFGTTCGLSQNGDLLHSLLNGPALQQLRNGVQAPSYLLGGQQQLNEQSQNPRNLEIESDGLLDKVMQQLVISNKDQVQGVVKHKIFQKALKKGDKNICDTKYYQFTILKDSEQELNNLILILSDVTELMAFLNSKIKSQDLNNQDIVQLKGLCLQSRLFASNQELISQYVQTYDILRQVSNLESLIAVREQNPVHIHVESFDLKVLNAKIKKNFEERFLDRKIKFTLGIDEKIDFYNFLTDNTKLQIIIENLLENSLEATYDGIIKLNIGIDIRSNCLSLSVEDNGVGIPNAVLAKLNPSNQIIQDLLNSELTSGIESINKPHHLGLQSSNYYAKMIGPKLFNKTIRGQVCSSGLHIQTVIDIGTKITFAIRNMTDDQVGQLYMIDKSINDELESDDQQELLERYIIGKELTQEDLYLFPQDNQNIKCQILKQSLSLENSLDQVKIIQEQKSPLIISDKPQLAGMLKLQQSGRIPLVIKKNRFQHSDIPTSQIIENTDKKCNCNAILFINSNYQFFQVIQSQQKSIPWYDRAKLVNEKDAVKQINRQMIDMKCIPLCQAYKIIVINCSNDNVDYNSLIFSIKQFYQKCQINIGRIIVLNYRPFGIMPPEVLVVQMPNPRWIQLIA